MGLGEEFSLWDIPCTGENNIILADRIEVKKECCGWLETELFPSRRYKSVNPDSIKQYARNVEELSEFYSNQSVYVTSSVVYLLGFVENIIKTDLKFFNDFESLRKEKYPDFIEERNEFNRKLLEEICLDYSRLRRGLKRRIIPVDDIDSYQLIEQVVDRVAKDSGAIKDNSVYHGRYKNSVIGEETDSNLVASAVYYSFFKNTPVDIVTEDSDKARLLKSFKKFGTYRISSMVENPLQKLKEVPVRVYFHTRGEFFKEVFDTSVDNVPSGLNYKRNERKQDDTFLRAS